MSTCCAASRHWLMKEPELEEEALRATARGNAITMQRQTLADTRRARHADRALGRDTQTAT